MTELVLDPRTRLLDGGRTLLGGDPWRVLRLTDGGEAVLRELLDGGEAVRRDIQVLKRAFTEDPFMFYGEHYKVPPRSLVPKPLQTPHPPLYLAATSPELHKLAGDLGVGVYSWSNFMGWDALAELVAAFRKRVRRNQGARRARQPGRRRADPGLLRRNRRDRRK